MPEEKVEHREQDAHADYPNKDSAPPFADALPDEGQRNEWDQDEDGKSAGTGHGFCFGILSPPLELRSPESAQGVRFHSPFSFEGIFAKSLGHFHAFEGNGPRAGAGCGSRPAHGGIGGYRRDISTLT
jgi:hypothetical protein